MIYKILFKRGNMLLFFFLVSCFLSRLNTEFYLIDIFGQLSFQILIGGILLFFILLILKRLLASVICILICILLTIDILSSCNQCDAFLEDKSQIHNKIRLMVFNVNHKNQIKNFEILLKQILFEKPDIILFQEVSPQAQDKLKSLESFYQYKIGPNTPTSPFASIILSNYALKENKVVDHFAIVTNVIMDGMELKIIGYHLYPQFNQTLFNLAINQTKYLKTLVKNIDQNLILMGDLNMTPVSKRFTNFLKETNLYTYTSYKNPTFTWPTFLPGYLGIQVDHVLFSKNFKMIRKKTIDYFESDHRPLIVDLAF